MKLAQAAVILAVLSGCATASKTYTADGKEGYTIDCNGTASSWSYCYEKAGELCKARGYEVIERNGERGFGAMGTPSGSLIAGSTFYRSMVVQCK